MLLSIARLVMAALFAVIVTGCGGGENAGPKIIIGTKYDEPGLAFRAPDGSMSGFDIDVARYVAGQLGYRDDQIEWTEVTTAKRESAIDAEPGGRLACTGTACERPAFIVGSYSITNSRKEKVDFAGPYLATSQRLLVRATDTAITGPDSLAGGQKACSVDGSTSARRMQDDYPKVQLVLEDSFSACVDALRAGQVDAVTTDEVILAGFAAQSPGTLKLVGKPFGEELYGIGLRKGDVELRDKINAALRKMEADGAWKSAFDKNLSAAGITAPAPPAIDQN